MATTSAAVMEAVAGAGAAEASGLLPIGLCFSPSSLPLGIMYREGGGGDCTMTLGLPHGGV